METQTQHYVRRDERREMIAQAARDLLAEKGLAGLRTRDIAARVGISVSTLQFHVRSKAALLDFIAETTRDAFLALLPPEPDPAKDALLQLRAEVQAFHDSLIHRPDLAATFAQLEQAAGGQAGLAATMAEFKALWAGRYTRILTIGRDQGLFRPDMAPLPAAMMVTATLVAFQNRGPDGLTLFWPVYDEIQRALLAPTP
ncbi:TetR/AcrR family transcriptional regulator [Chachezhania sediminis]|uniref:TetR/AcrR family transcriptional regulator n=1 Tax=Chachezhania sediminis TaxID=2599291 RepID=UPI00131CA12F|nr:TetR/AcrR family transcriptional regulator [Chachezhania sediminis]